MSALPGAADTRTPSGTAASGVPSLAAYDPDTPVSVIIVNWNGRVHLETCIDSLRRQTLAPIEIIVVDNGSTDGSVEFMRARFADVVLIEHADNLGYATALNKGIRAATGRYLIALNNDVELEPTCLAALVDTADAYPNAAFCAPKILSFFDRGLIDNVGHLLYLDGLSRGRGRLERDRGQYDTAAEIVGPSGCAVLIRRAVLVDVGLFDDDLFAYCEDTDLGLRAQIAGWTCRYVPEAIVYHKYSASTAEYSPLKAFLVERNRAWVAVKCLPGPLLLASPVFTLLRLGAQAFAVFTRRGAAGEFAVRHSPRTLLVILVRAWWAALRGLPAAWRKRREVQHHRRLSAVESTRALWRYRMSVKEIALKE